MSATREWVRARVAGFRRDAVSREPILLLAVEKRRSVFPLWLSERDAVDIDRARRREPGGATELCARALGGFAIEHLRTEIAGMERNALFARALFRRGSDYVAVECRPEDGIALALTGRADILLDRALFESRKQRMDDAADTYEEME